MLDGRAGCPLWSLCNRLKHVGTRSSGSIWSCAGCSYTVAPVLPAGTFRRFNRTTVAAVLISLHALYILVSLRTSLPLQVGLLLKPR